MHSRKVAHSRVCRCCRRQVKHDRGGTVEILIQVATPARSQDLLRLACRIDGVDVIGTRRPIVMRSPLPVLRVVPRYAR